MNMFGSIGKLAEGRTRNELHNSARAREEGFEINEEIDSESDIDTV